MNSDTMEAVQGCLKDAGAVVKCSGCGNAFVTPNDADAEHRAYAMATNARKGGTRGFRGMTLEEVMEAIKSALDETPSCCPSCRG